MAQRRKSARLHNRIAEGLRRGKRQAKDLPAYWFEGDREYPEHDPGRPNPQPGTRVRLTGQYLRETGQQTGDEGFKVWTVQECKCSLCALGLHVAVDQFAYAGDLGRGPWRHIAAVNLEDVDRLERLEREGRAALLARQKEQSG